MEALQLQLQNSVSTLEGDVPLFVPKPGVELIHAHAKLFEGHLKNSGKKILFELLSSPVLKIFVWLRRKNSYLTLKI